MGILHCILVQGLLEIVGVVLYYISYIAARVELLKNNGGDMSLVNAQGQTPLFFTTQSVVFTPNK